jgi:hypothetical protein
MAMPKHRVQLMYVNQSGKPLTDTLYEAFNKAGWSDQITYGDGGGSSLGIIAGPGASNAKTLKEAIESTTKLKVSLDKPTVPGIDLVYLFVGINSPEAN